MCTWLVLCKRRGQLTPISREFAFERKANVHTYEHAVLKQQLRHTYTIEKGVDYLLL